MNEQRKPWQRFALSLLGILIIVFLWRWSVLHLYSLPVTSITAFTSITTNCMYSVAVIVIFMITGKLVWDWKNSTVSEVVQRAEDLSERYKGETTERIIAPKAFDDVTEIQ